MGLVIEGCCPQGGPVPNERTKTNRNKNQRWTLTTNLGTAFCFKCKANSCNCWGPLDPPYHLVFYFLCKIIGGCEVTNNMHFWIPLNKHQHRKRGVQNSLCPQESILLMYDFQWNPTLFFRGSWPRSGL